MAQLLRGLGVSPGVAIGSAYLLHVDPLPVVPTPIPPERVGREIEVFHAAREAARTELRQLRNRVSAVLGDHYAEILEAQMLILDDPGLIADTEQTIKVGRVSVRWALKQVVEQLTRHFDAMGSDYLREREGDVSDVHRRLQRLLRGGVTLHEEMPEGRWIIVAHSVVPSDAVTLAGKGVVGLATDVGGRTSHTAILAQALSVPAVAGLHDFSQRVRPGDQLVVDGGAGEIHLLPGPEELQRAENRRRAWIAVERRAQDAERDLPTRTRDGVEVAVRANIEFPGELDHAHGFGAQGIGLYRSEYLFLSHAPQLPSEDVHYRTYRAIAESVAPQPAVIRTLDLGGEKYFHEVLDRDEPNPVLGLRAVRLCLQRPDIFLPQLRGLLRAATSRNLRIMLPMVTNPDEIRAVRRLIAREAEQLEASGTAVRADVPVGIMIEVPGAAASADILAREADFFSLGTNDLIQYALAVDRGNESVSYLYQPLHPGVLRMLKFVVDSAAERGIPLSVCGEMAADVDAVPLLVGLGVRELSVQPRAIAGLRQLIRDLDSASAAREAEQTLRGLFDAPVSQEVERG